MKQIIIHVGLPRTGTTTLQKSIFKLTNKTLVLSKNPYSPSSKTNEKSILINTHDPRVSIYENEAKQLYDEIFVCALKLSINRSRAEFKNRLEEAISKTLKISEGSQKQILFSTERLVDTSTSLDGNSIKNPNSEVEFPIYPLCHFTSKTGMLNPSITVCMRDPIKYLRSKYLRTVSHRRAQKTLRDLSPVEYIQKQARLENNTPGTSALKPAMHAEFIKQLQQRAFVKAFGFQELLASDDVFSLIGLQGEDKYAFRDFPRENKLSSSKEQEQAIEMEITKALKQYGFYDRIMKAQMFE
tara:strand:- start:229 stop:1125 length:897 start_codon:yes stop_codon:yes gene_type:complete